MEFVKRIARRKVIIARCENCNREIEVPFDNAIQPLMPSTDLKDVVHCECGEIHNLIVEPARPKTQSVLPRAKKENTPLQCPRCGSTQLHAGDKGFSLGKAALDNLLAGPVGILGGFIGSKKIMITCLKCGKKWQAGKY